jgi:hypothetical protein
MFSVLVVVLRPDHIAGQGIEKIVRNDFQGKLEQIERLDQGVSAAHSATGQSSSAA